MNKIKDAVLNKVKHGGGADQPQGPDPNTAGPAGGPAGGPGGIEGQINKQAQNFANQQGYGGHDAQIQSAVHAGYGQVTGQGAGAGAGGAAAPPPPQ